MTTAPSAPACPAPPAAPARRNDDAAQRRHRDDFERSLRSREQAGEDETGDGDSSSASTAATAAAAPVAPFPADALAALFLPLRAPMSVATPPAVDAAGALDTGNATQAAVQTQLQLTPPATPVTEAATASAWEVTLRQPLAVPVDVRAVRTDAAHGWALEVGSPAVVSATLSQHVPKLNARLKAHTAHARIAGSDPGENQP